MGKPYYEKGFAKRFVGNAAAQRYREHYFGALKFDVVIDMWGKPSFWQLIFAKTQFEKKVAYLPKLVTPQMLVYLKKQFDQLVCVDAKLYPKYKKMLQNIEGKAELLLIPLPVDLSNFVRDLQEDMSYLMSYAKTAAVNLEQHKEEFYFNEHINQYQEMMRAPVLKASDELSQAMEARMAAYQKEYQESQQQFAALFSVAK